ncbi:hypothetical protein IIV22A_083L [Invertebrate iridescent virus 22]|uniref:Uncharacterized protein n=1 Tax=Invertebrate iridescent virus 22 TaxID=345198 RepID=W8W1C5_9VIRU|nr:hypothetical protein IIV22A_083L [Invertebrate iridescent virus 22]CCV01927.1 hypothetical protein IIV22A_083L [Invertebrate iridescent virus 22]
MDFEFVSTHRNRNIWPNPCLFEVPSSGSGQSNGLNASDPISNQAPIVVWTGQNISIAATVVTANSSSVVVSANLNLMMQKNNYYQGAEVNVPPSFRIESSKFLGQNGGLDYTQLSVVDSKLNSGDNVMVKVTNIPNTIYVPGGSNLQNAYTGKLLYNQTKNEWVVITSYDSEFHKVVADIPSGWSITDKFSIRDNLPHTTFITNSGNTTTTLNLTGIMVSVNPGDFIRIISTEEMVKIINFDFTTNIVTVDPPLSTILPAGESIELLAQTSENYKTLSYSGTTVGQQEQTAYNVTLVSGSLPNILIKNGSGGYPIDYPFLYVEFYDTNYPSQNNLFSNNHSAKSYFKVTTPIGQVYTDTTQKFTKFTGDLSHKIIRFRPTSNFRIVWRLPTGEEIKFEEEDTQSPLPPKESIQTSVQFNLKRN